MDWIPAIFITILIGIGANLDNVALGIAYGLGKVRIPHWVNLVINLIGFIFALLGAYLGSLIIHWITPVQASWTVCMILCFVGLLILYAEYVQPLFTDKKDSKLPLPGLLEGIILGISLSFTNIAGGFSATASNISSLWVSSFIISILGYLLLWLGNSLGVNIFSKFLGKYSSLVSGLLLIGVGISQVL